MSVPATHPDAFLGPESVDVVPPPTNGSKSGPGNSPRNDPGTSPEGPRLKAVPDAPERRGSGRRARARDRLMDRANELHAPHPRLRGVANVENLLMFVDDDLRETALAIHRIEQFLLRTLGLLEAQDLRREHVLEVAGDTSVLDHVDQLNETLESLRRRLARLAARMK
ncbi:hypothetical protein [Paraliomyxa miuraensis]|uniref:hypothetical protein n=1 Tax=Paraliomyxa miuraensis TaxID=376150 RepID=UPI002252AEAB|nr:hypothetical protein [Paraliomyxa miuraensis]MCX4243539.1 hypothetical protein [Paraliomyxa miuraensis]